jgi:histidinol-phosphate/aromatic aminotransferase/cobyric acid decarboxylase-like protein
MQRTARFGSVTVLSAAAGLAALQDSARSILEIEENRKVREFTLKAFRQIGREVTNSQTNFVWANVGQTSKSFRDSCFDLDVLVGRDFRPIGNHYSRISLGTMDEMRQAVQVFETVLTEDE